MSAAAARFLRSRTARFPARRARLYLTGGGAARGQAEVQRATQEASAFKRQACPSELRRSGNTAKQENTELFSRPTQQDKRRVRPEHRVRSSVSARGQTESTELELPNNRNHHKHKRSISRNFPGIRSRGAERSDLRWTDTHTHTQTQPSGAL